MKIILSEPRGFCAGVDRAIHIVDEALDLLPPPIYVNHEIVHNSHVVDSFKGRGVIFVEDITEVPDKSVLIFNAHGVPPELVNEAKRREMQIIDATCPLVSKVHFAALRHAKQGHHVFLIGHAGHAEVIGIMGHAPDNITLVESAEDVPNLIVPDGKEYAYVTQTTLSIADCQIVIDALKERFPNVIAPKQSNICYATTNRQAAIKTVAQQSDVVLVVGSANSSNSRRLSEVAEDLGTKSYLVNSPQELEFSWFKETDKVGISAGASTPESIVQAVITALKEQFSVESIDSEVSIVETEKFSLPKIG